MKKNAIPATIAALAISLTSVSAPHALADEAPVTANQTAGADVTLRAGESVAFSAEEMLKAVGHGPTGTSSPTITSIKSSIEGGTGPFSMSWKDNHLRVGAESKPGVYDVAVELITSDSAGETLKGTLTIEVIGAGLSGNANVLDASEEPQNTGLTLANEGASSIVVTDAAGKTIEHHFSNTGEMTVTPGEDAIGPLTVTVTDDSLSSPLSRSIPLRVTATVSPGNYVAKADGGRYFSGVTLTQATGETKLTAVDEDGTTIKADRTGGKIYLTTPTDVNGPITLTVADPTLPGGFATFTITVKGHEEGVDDSDTEDDGEETTAISVSGTAQEVVANGESQFTGLTLVNGSEDTSVTAKDEDGTAVTVAVADDGKISVTPKEDTVGPITITVADDSLEEALTKEVTVKAPSDNDSPLSSDIGDFGLVALGAVLAAIVGIIGAIATGIIQLPF